MAENNLSSLALVLVAAISLAACAKDRGQCLEKKLVEHPAYTWVQMIPTGNGALIPVFHYVPRRVTLDCVKWEYPNGKE